jgi:drug/metabolite transporter (DMT)-like permease
MLASILTTLLFAVSAVCATRSTRLLGSLPANFWRLIVATLLLAMWAHSFGQGLRGPALFVFLVSGLIGFGLGDLALYLAYPRLGSHLTILLAQCLAAPFGAAIEWLWLGTSLTIPQMFWGVCILSGVMLAVAPRKLGLNRQAMSFLGVAAGVFAALGQAGGAVLSRKAFAVADAAGYSIDGLTAAYQRILAGLALVGLVYLGSVLFPATAANRAVVPGGGRVLLDKVRLQKPARFWVVLNGLSGPALGVGCYQWALAHTPSGIVLPIVATTPLAVIPLVFFLEGEKPSARSLLGGLLAVVGSAGLAMAL